ncbi:MAG: carbohydrate ABC transporter permease [Candidatus Limnocylindrus sp.]
MSAVDGLSAEAAAAEHIESKRRVSTRRRVLVTFAVAILTFLFFAPLFNLASISLKDPDQVYAAGSPLYPARAKQVEVDGKERPVVLVPQDDGSFKELVLVKPGRQESLLADPTDVTKTILWQGSWRTLENAWEFSATFNNFGTVWEILDYPTLLRNTLIIAVIGTIGTVVSCVLVAYGFSRLRFPGRGKLFQVMVATIFIPGTVTLIPTYMLFLNLGWVNTWLPLLVPTFVANAFDVFLIRQYMMTIPREHDEAAQIEGASPWQTLRYVIIPQSRPVIIAVTIFHFVYSWNDYFGPLIYLSTKPELQTLGIGLSRFSSQYSARVGYPEAATLMTIAIPIILFIIFQRYFVRGVVVTGVDK